jgi:hypothetical protein
MIHGSAAAYARLPRRRQDWAEVPGKDCAEIWPQYLAKAVFHVAPFAFKALSLTI